MTNGRNGKKGSGKKLGVRRPLAVDYAVMVVGVAEIKALRAERKVLSEKIEALDKDLKPREQAAIMGLEAGLPAEPGCPPVAVDVEERVVPGWKAEAVKLAKAAGKDPGVYEAEVRAATAATVIKRLVINGEGR